MAKAGSGLYFLRRCRLERATKLSVWSNGLHTKGLVDCYSRSYAASSSRKSLQGSRPPAADQRLLSSG
jgi:hypothetical protein